MKILYLTEKEKRSYTRIIKSKLPDLHLYDGITIPKGETEDVFTYTEASYITYKIHKIIWSKSLKNGLRIIADVALPASWISRTRHTDREVFMAHKMECVLPINTIKSLIRENKIKQLGI